MPLNLPFRWDQTQSPKVNLILGAVRTVLEYVAVVMGGAAALTGVARGFGIIASPAPAGLFASVVAAVVGFVQLLPYPLPAFAWIVAGILLFGFARWTMRVPGVAARPMLAAVSLILSALVGAVFSPAYVPVLFTAAMGYLVSQTVTAICAGVLGGIFGFFLLPQVRDRSLNTSPMLLGHWIAAGAWVLFFAIGVMQLVYTLGSIALAGEPRLSLVYARWLPGDGAVHEEPIGPGNPNLYLTQQEIAELQAAGLTGAIRVLGRQVGSDPFVRFVVIMSRPVQETVDLPKPASGDILYIQTQQGWRKFPASAPTIRRTVRLMYFGPDKYFSLPTMRPHVDIGLGHPNPEFFPQGWMYAPSDWPASWQLDPPSLPEGATQ